MSAGRGSGRSTAGEARLLCAVVAERGWWSSAQARACIQQLDAEGRSEADGDHLIEAGLMDPELVDRARRCFERACATGTSLLASTTEETRRRGGLWKTVTTPVIEAAPPERIGRYLLGDELGRGAMGVVFRAEDTVLRVPVAVKLLPSEHATDDTLRRRLLEEARHAASVRDTNHVVAVFEAGVQDGTPFVVMELVAGETLAEWIHARRPPFAHARESLRLAREVADGLSVVHDRGLVHCDIKPANVMVTTEGRAKILDFGIARNTVAGGARAGRAAVGGTPLYMAPEVLSITLGDTPYEEATARSPRLDVYSLGATLLEMLLRENAFKGAATPRALLESKRDRTHLTSACARIEGLRRRDLEDLRELITSMLAEEYGSRPATASHALARWVEPGADHGPWSGVDRRFGLAACASAAIAALLHWVAPVGEALDGLTGAEGSPRVLVPMLVVAAAITGYRPLRSLLDHRLRHRGREDRRAEGRRAGQGRRGAGAESVRRSLPRFPGPPPIPGGAPSVPGEVPPMPGAEPSMPGEPPTTFGNLDDSLGPPPGASPEFSSPVEADEVYARGERVLRLGRGSVGSERDGPVHLVGAEADPLPSPHGRLVVARDPSSSAAEDPDVARSFSAQWLAGEGPPDILMVERPDEDGWLDVLRAALLTAARDDLAVRRPEVDVYD